MRSADLERTKHILLAAFSIVEMLSNAVPCTRNYFRARVTQAVLRVEALTSFRWNLKLNAAEGLAQIRNEDKYNSEFV